MTTILATLDGSSTSEAVLPVLSRLAAGLGATVHLLTVVVPPTGTRGRSRGPETFIASGSPNLGVPVTDTGPVIEPVDPGWIETEGQAIARVMDQGRDLLGRYAEPLRLAGLQVEFDVVIGDDAAETIIESAREHAADFIAMATHGRGGLNQLVQGSVASAVVRSGVAPVVLVRPTISPAVLRIPELSYCQPQAPLAFYARSAGSPYLAELERARCI